MGIRGEPWWRGAHGVAKRAVVSSRGRVRGMHGQGPPVAPPLCAVPPSQTPARKVRHRRHQPTATHRHGGADGVTPSRREPRRFSAVGWVGWQGRRTRPRSTHPLSRRAPAFSPPLPATGAAYPSLSCAPRAGRAVGRAAGPPPEGRGGASGGATALLLASAGAHTSLSPGHPPRTRPARLRGGRPLAPPLASAATTYGGGGALTVSPSRPSTMPAPLPYLACRATADPWRLSVTMAAITMVAAWRRAKRGGGRRGWRSRPPPRLPRSG